MQPDPPSKSLLTLKFRELIINLTTGQGNPKICHCFQEISSSGKRALRPAMEHNFQFDLKLSEFAKLSCRSLATFNRDFYKEFQTSPGRWLKRERLKYSKFLLKTTDLNVNQITLEAGFKNTSHFIRIFKQYYRSTPLKYRQTLLEDHTPVV